MKGNNLVWRRHWRSLLFLVLIGLTAEPAVGMAQTLKTVAGEQRLLAAPSYSAEVVATIPAGSEVSILQESGEWSQVEYQGQKGWLPARAFASGKKLDLSTLLRGKAVKESKTDEVALAAKGFTPEVEAGFRQKHPDLRYDQVDQIEQFNVSAAELQAFRQEGGLR
ncbi:MAG: SH3 domain-containing protein [Desulfobacca sp.]|uniref:SH3 domain-containing protein n=1 Tax=Desulfobacca sp. TaxID=2067990 RepID=UPI00404B6A07